MTNPTVRELDVIVDAKLAKEYKYLIPVSCDEISYSLLDPTKHGEMAIDIVVTILLSQYDYIIILIPQDEDGDECQPTAIACSSLHFKDETEAITAVEVTGANHYICDGSLVFVNELSDVQIIRQTEITKTNTESFDNN